MAEVLQVVSVSAVVSNLMELEGRSSEKFGLGSDDRGRQPEGGGVSDLREGLKVYGRDWVTGPEKAAYRGGCTGLRDPPGGAMRKAQRYHDHPSAPTLNGPRPAHGDGPGQSRRRRGRTRSLRPLYARTAKSPWRAYGPPPQLGGILTGGLHG